jgi:hypothetical protein
MPIHLCSKGDLMLTKEAAHSVVSLLSNDCDPLSVIASQFGSSLPIREVVSRRTKWSDSQ